MQTLNVTISDKDYKRFGIKSNNLSFAEMAGLIKKEIAVETLDKCIEMAEKHGLSRMISDEINEEVNAVRKNAKARH